MKKQTLKIVFAALLVVASVFSLASCATWDGIKEDVNNLVDDQVIENDNLSLSLCASAAVVVPATDDAPAYVEKTIAATVLPEKATNKALEWEILWLENTLGEDAKVTDYVTIETSGEINNVCTVRCYQAFGDSVIGIKVKTVKGECEAQCEVTFVGEPSELAINLDGVESDGDKVTLLAGNNYSFAVALENIFEQVGEEYGTYTMAVTVNGSYKAMYGTEQCIMTLEKPADGLAVFRGVIGGTTKEINYLVGSLYNGVLYIDAQNGYDSDSYFHSCVDDIIPSVTFTITETVSGLSTSITVVVETAAAEINMDSALAF